MGFHWSKKISIFHQPEGYEEDFLEIPFELRVGIQVGFGRVQ